MTIMVTNYFRRKFLVLPLLGFALPLTTYLGCRHFFKNTSGLTFIGHFYETSLQSTWLEQRQLLMSGTKKVFMFAYMRGGSSIGGELFNQDPHATMWYEPNDAFFSSYYGLKHHSLPQHDLYLKNMTRRILNSDEKSSMTAYFSNMLTCQYQDLPPEAMGHYFLQESTAMDRFTACVGKRSVDINKCVTPITNFCSGKFTEKARSSGCHEIITATRLTVRIFDNEPESKIIGRIQEFCNISSDLAERFLDHEICLQTMSKENRKCIEPAIERCLSDQVQVLQVNRMKMEDLEQLIQLHPDIYVIYYIRDPRAILMSRMNNQHLLWKPGKDALREETRILCHRMNEDLRQFKILQGKYPGAFLQIKYEDLVQKPESTAGTIYEFLGKQMPKSWIRFAKNTMHSKINDGGTFGIRVANATETAIRWKKTFPREQLKLAEDLCKDFITDSGYSME